MQASDLGRLQALVEPKSSGVELQQEGRLRNFPHGRSSTPRTSGFSRSFRRRGGPSSRTHMPLRECWRSSPSVTHGDLWLRSLLPVPTYMCRPTLPCSPRCPPAWATAARPGCRERSDPAQPRRGPGWSATQPPVDSGTSRRRRGSGSRGCTRRSPRPGLAGLRSWHQQSGTSK
jgi:hypothetical protein